MSISIYSPAAEDFSTNGLGLLSPTECIVEERAAGMCELTLVHPIDRDLRWGLIQPGCILKAPAPVRETPLYESEATGGEEVTVTRRIWRVERTTHGAYLRSGPGMNYKKLAIKKNGDEVIELEDCADPWIKVCVVKGGAVGYMSTKWLGLNRTESETISPARPVGRRVVEIAPSRDQLFRIYSVEQDAARHTVTARALHIFYDESANLIGGECSLSGADVPSTLAEIEKKLVQPPQVKLQAIGLTGSVSGDYGYKSPVEALLDPDAGVVSQTRAQLIRDNFDAFLIPDRERDMGVTIRRGKNLRGVAVTSDSSAAVTRILPTGRKQNGDVLTLADPPYVDSPRISAHPRPRAARIEYDVQTGQNGVASDAAARAELKRLAELEFSEKGVDLPSYGMDVDFVLLGNTDECRNYASLQAVHLYDTVTVIDELIGLTAKLRVTGCRFNCLTGQYENVTLGDLRNLTQTLYSYSLPDGGVSGAKIATGSLSGAALRTASIEYAKITSAAVEQLSSAAITALTARINEIVAQKLTADALYAAYADLIALKAGTITADNIETDALAAELARITVLAAGSANFDRATVEHLVSRAMNLEFGAAGQLFIRNLAVEYAQMVGAQIGNLCIRASDGDYYRLDVSPDGSVTAEAVSVSADEISAGQTAGGKIILETSITASALNASNLLAAYALVNRIDAARIDVDALFARRAFISLLATSQIVGEKSIAMIARQADQALESASAAMICDSAEPPETALAEGKLWLDRGVSPAVLRRWLGHEVSPARSHAGSAEGNPVILQGVGRIESFDSLTTRFSPVQEGEGDPSPNNIRPITGCDALDLTAAGKNLFTGWVPGERPNPSTGVFNALESAARTDYIPVLPSQRMEVSGLTDALFSFTAFYDKNKAFIERTGAAGRTRESFATPENCYYVVITQYENSNVAGTIADLKDAVQLEYGASITEYVPFAGLNTFSAEFPQTIYGGTMDWLTGTLAARWKLRKLTSGYTWNYTTGSGNELFFLGLSEGSIIGHGASGFLCSHYPTGESIWTQESARGSVVNTNSGKFQPGFVFAEGAFGSVDAWTAFLDAQNAAGTPVQIAYPVTEPTEIQLVPAQISPLEGVNTLFGDGDAIALSYAASGWEIVNDVQTIKSALDQVRETANNAVSRAEQQQYMRLEPDGLYVGLLDRNGGRTRVTFQSFDVIRADGYVSASLGDARQDIGSMTLYSTAEGHTAFVPREV